ncbi:MAG: T9SS C-terminal target domain-containing protein [Sphingobacteriales bacterium]|nr:MAG: T9SS C-terminal target domain-containing protein [Sphingobacteriales bacterium]
MKSKLLLLLLTVSTGIALAATKFDGLASIKFYLNKIETIINNKNPTVKTSRSSTVTMCGTSNTNYTKAAVTPMLWSSNSTWSSFGATKPVAGSVVNIPIGVHIILDESTPSLAGLNVLGKLEFANQNLSLTSSWIMVMGTFEIGTSTMPYTKKAVITLNGTNTSEVVMGMTSTRGIMVMGGKLELHGNPPNKTWTKINAHTPQGSSNLVLSESVNWNPNDQIVVAPTDYYYSGGESQRVSISSISGTNISTSEAMIAHRWGLMQYATSTGMSLTPGPVPATVVAGTPTELDERAEVGNLTRNIVIQSPDDISWQSSGLGCHVMIMRYQTNTGVAHLDGVEIKRGGQKGKLGRYPFHWHMLSYDGTATLADATGQYIKNSVINESAQRGIVIHGTNGVLVSNNVVYDVLGHGIFTEDASERRLTIDGNLVLKVRNPETPLKVHESEMGFGSSGLWVSNPDNILTNNVMADCIGFGIWLAYPERTFGLSAKVGLRPNVTLFGVFNKNTAHSNQLGGIHLDDPEGDELGNLSGGRYTSTTNMQSPQWPYDEVKPYYLEEYTVWKNNISGIWNRSNSPRNIKAVSADNTNKFFSGASDNIMSGTIERTLIIGKSLNYNMNGVITPGNWNADQPAVAFASYHSTFDLKDNFVLNFEAVNDKASGAFALDDYYLIPVDKGTVRNPNNTIVNSHPGVRTLPNMPQFTFGVVWDHHDYWGGPADQDNYYVFNTPFFTYGQTPTLVAPNAATSGGVITEGPYYGVEGFVINKVFEEFGPMNEIQINRLNNQMQTVGTWGVGQGIPGQILPNMRHFATHPSGIYDLNFPTVEDVHDLYLNISNMLTTNDYQVIGAEYNGNYAIDAVFTSTSGDHMNFGDSTPLPTNQSDTHVYQSVNSLAEVINAPLGEVYWQDRVNNKVWVKIRGGLNSGDASLPWTNDYNLYKYFKLRAYGSPASTLAIKFESFDAVKQSESKVRLAWAFNTDQENVNFEILRKTADGKFTLIGKIENKKTVKGLNQVSFVDENPFIGDNYYQIKAIDKDGKVSNSATKSVKILTLTESTFSIFPNPVTSTLNIKFNSITAGNINLLVYNSTGKIVKQVQISANSGDNNFATSLSDVPTGTYALKITVNGKIITKKFVKQ